MFFLIGINASFIHSILFLLLIWIAIIDIYEHLIPDILVLATFLTLYFLLIFPNILASLLTGGSLIILKLSLERFYKKLLIGWGDIKLLIVTLLFLPATYFPCFFFMCGASFLLVYGLTSLKKLPFAPFIVTGLLSVMFFAY